MNLILSSTYSPDLAEIQRIFNVNANILNTHITQLNT